MPECTTVLFWDVKHTLSTAAVKWKPYQSLTGKMGKRDNLAHKNIVLY